MQVTKEQIVNAKQINLIDYLLSRGEQIKKRDSSYFVHEKHDSLIFNINKNMFMHLSKQAKGDSIEFLMYFYNHTFQSAVLELLEYSGVHYDLNNNDKNNIENTNGNIDIHYNNDCKNAIAYLVKTRNINYKIISEFIEKKLIAQDLKNNIVFKYKENNKTVGAELCGTLSNIRFKQVVKNSKRNSCFNFKIGKGNTLLFFESPVDLISYYEIYFDKLFDHHLYSLGGLKENIFIHHSKDSKNIFLCVDNDSAGDLFIEKIKKNFSNLNIKSHRPNEKYKDWNEQLKVQKEKVQKELKNVKYAK